MGGSSGSGKTTFLNGTYTPFQDELLFQIGVSFKLIDCLINNEDSFLFQVWDFKIMKRFQCLYPSFCKGAKGALLCFDVSNYNSFNELHYWIEIIRKNAGNIPIILIGTKNDLNRVISDVEIREIIEKYHLDGIFFSAFNDYNRDIVLKHLIRKIGYFSHISRFNIVLPESDKAFNDFIRFFSFCPICGRKNHFNNLKKFYYTKNPKLMKLKEQLLELFDRSKDFLEIYYNKINVGIPCCLCFKKFFETK